MSNLEQVESQVRRFNADELDGFREWFAAYDMEMWDRQIESESKKGALDSLADRALADHKADRSTIL